MPVTIGVLKETVRGENRVAVVPEVATKLAAQGAKVWRVNGLINDCGKIVGEAVPPELARAVAHHDGVAAGELKHDA